MRPTDRGTTLEMPAPPPDRSGPNNPPTVGWPMSGRQTMTDSSGPVKPRLSDESVNLDQPRWQLSQALVRGEVKPHAFLTGHHNGEERPARSTPRSESAVFTGLAVSVAAAAAFIVGAVLLFRRD